MKKITQSATATIQNLHAVEVKYFGATDTNGARIKITSYRFEQSFYLPFDYSLNDQSEGAIKELQKRGFEFIGKAEGKNITLLLSTTFEPIK